MASYLRSTPLTPRVVRETTLGRARVARRPRLRRAPSAAGLPAVAHGGAGAVPLGREGERPRPHGDPVGHRARARRGPDEGRGAAATTLDHPALSRAQRVPRHRRPARRGGPPRQAPPPP